MSVQSYENHGVAVDCLRTTFTSRRTRPTSWRRLRHHRPRERPRPGAGPARRHPRAVRRRPSTNPALARIVNGHHFDRLVRLLDSCRTVVGGEHDRDDLHIAPTVLADVSPRSPVMSEEIFGLILPVVVVDDVEDAINFVNDREKALALYVFTHSETIRERFLKETSSGTPAFGIPLLHIAVRELPFGGRTSGTAKFHGRYSVETFSNRKAVFDMPL
jgi:aldehyde dehydrogenase (NAD+)